MNKYVFPGADASCALNWVIGQVSGDRFNAWIPDLTLSVFRLRPLDSRSSPSMSLECTTLPPSGSGTRTGSPTRRRSSPSTVTGGSESGPTSLPTQPSPRVKEELQSSRLLSTRTSTPTTGLRVSLPTTESESPLRRPTLPPSRAQKAVVTMYLHRTRECARVALKVDAREGVNRNVLCNHVRK